MSTKKNSVSLLWLTAHVVLTVVTGGFWLVILLIWFIMKQAKK